MMTAPSPLLHPDRRPFGPRGAALALWRDRSPEIVVSGPAGTGKSRACLEKLHWCATKYPRMRGLILRKTRHSLTESALVTWEEKVIPAGSPVLGGARRSHRQEYRYPNGSTVAVGGLDDPTRIMSTEYDLVFVQEAIELTEPEWEAVSTRLRNDVVPYQQIIADTNPGAPSHWIRQRAAAGKLRMIESRHEDNPAIWNARRGEWTARGRAYIDRLETLTGVRRDRLRFGRWVQAEGVVYEGYDSAVHLIDRFAVPDSWPRYWDFDFGFTNPFVWHEWVQDDDGRLFLYREIYHTGRLVEDHARRINELTAGGPRPRAVVCDHDAEGRATLERHLRITTVPAKKEVLEGIQAVSARLRPAGDGRPRLLLMRNTVDRIDPELVEAKRPTCTADEWEGYVWKTAGKKEEPVKENDHGLDGTRYIVQHLDSRQPVYFRGVPK